MFGSPLLLLCVRRRCIPCISICVIIWILMHIIFQFVCRIYMTSHSRECKSRRHLHCVFHCGISFHTFFIVLILFGVLSFSFALHCGEALLIWHECSRACLNIHHIFHLIYFAPMSYIPFFYSFIFKSEYFKRKISGADGNVESTRTEWHTARALFGFVLFNYNFRTNRRCTSNKHRIFQNQLK